MTNEYVHHSALPAERTAVVTGASSGIGRAVALALARAGVRLCVVGRNPHRPAQTVAAAQSLAPVKSFQLDLVDDHSLQPLIEYLEKNAGKLDILIHSAGAIQQDLLEHPRIEDLDDQYVEVNPKGIRVLSVYLGRTVTAMQETLFEQEARPYDAEKFCSRRTSRPSCSLRLCFRGRQKLPISLFAQWPRYNVWSNLAG